MMGDDPAFLDLLLDVPLYEEKNENENEGTPGGSNGAYGNCVNCAGSLWNFNVTSGAVVCSLCGCCQDWIPLCEVSFLERAADLAGRPASAESAASLLPGGRKRSARSTPYERITYLRERLSQWSRTEPAIPAKDWEVILTEFVGWCQEKGLQNVHIPDIYELRRGKGLPGTVVLTKEEIGEILDRCDVKREQPGPGDWNFGMDSSDPDFIQFGLFKRRYLERWYSIRWRLSGVGTTADKLPAQALTAICEVFLEVVEAFRRVVYKRGRTSMLSYNFVLCRIFDLLGLSDCNADFPELQSPKKRQEMSEYWKRICAYHFWPYINTDELPEDSKSHEESPKKRTKYGAGGTNTNTKTNR